MKKRNIILLGSLLTGCVPIIGVSTSCPSKQLPKKDIQESILVEEFYKKFLTSVQGRWTGNANNFKATDLETDGSLKDIGNNKTFTETELKTKLINNLGIQVTPSKVNYGSLHAYQYLKKTIEDMGYKNNNPEVIYPQKLKVTIEEKDVNGRKVDFYNIENQGQSFFEQVGSQTTIEVNGKEKSIAEGITFSKDNNALANKLLENGFISQGFLWNGVDRINGTIGANNIGTNICVTINPTDSSITSDPAKIKDFFIVSHYDSTAEGPKKASWGATDNGTSVGTNLSLLKFFSKVENQKLLKCRLHILFADAEEVGVFGTFAFVHQFLKDSNLQKSSIGALNIDTVAGGDILYVHSRKPSNGGNTDPKLRDKFAEVSKKRAAKLNSDKELLNIHPKMPLVNQQGQGFDVGETGDWSDHAAFGIVANIPNANIEATNFHILSSTGEYDGYSMTINKAFWETVDPADKEKLLIEKKKYPNTDIDVYEPNLAEDKILLRGNIWHSDLDTLEWTDKYIGKKLYEQLDTVYQTIIEFLKEMTL
ncbi:M28 family peptidase [Mycoplasmopsis caviae]|uniref:M28 family peptidase n=1 Tax=Mycoplasmopsis caviae TaxID=55603 RepID=A0A3P8L6H8_9BACT|nr:M28 family peptidase [Mycoplasmopsis caviae]UUD35659.1 M28 family peptidase [Mycoplasmopsis caviae]VDR41595.1 Peptidase family M28 [Mycoplasmopsis caviae]